MTKFCPRCAQTYDASVEYCPADHTLLRLADPLVGTTLDGRYLITERLGEGGMGRVYRATHIRLRRDAAIKVLNPSYLADPESRRRFASEAELLIQVDSEHVARVYDFGELPDGQLYLALEFVAGQPLSALTQGAPLPPTRVADISRQLAAGLDAVHKCGLVHRDIKPDNVMIARDADGRDIVKLIDFGIARWIDGTGQITRTGCIVGTPDYMSPEQVSGEHLDAGSDIYTFGLLAVLMLTGRLPFPNETFEQALASRLMGEPRLLRELAPEVEWPAAVQEVIDRALARDRAARYATAGGLAGELASAIEAWQQARPGVPATAAVRRRPTAWAVAGAAAAGVLTLALVAVALNRGPGDRAAAANGDIAAALETPRTRPAVRGGPPTADLVVAPQAATLPNASDPGTTRTPASHSARPTGRASSLSDTGHSRASAAAGVLPPVEVQRQLDRIEKRLDPATVTQVMGQEVLADLAALLPRVGTHDDSMRAGLLAFQAHLHSDQLVRGCDVLRAVYSLATREQYREAARLWLDELCR
jgi:eukaryotic-like serine/threonine-protein kinase